MNPTVRRYHDDAITTTFTGTVVAAGTQHGRTAVALAETWFYPESGGQLGDRGTLGGVSVVDVQVDDDGVVWHLLEGPAPTGEVACTIDWARRFEHMQQHTGQHVLSAALERTLDVSTISSTLGDERDVIEIGRESIDWATVARLEAVTNQVLWEDRAVRSHWTDDQGVAAFKEEATVPGAPWVSTINGSPVPSGPPFGSELWGFGGFPKPIHPNTTEFVVLSDLATLTVAQGDKFFISMRVADKLPQLANPAGVKERIYTALLRAALRESRR